MYILFVFGLPLLGPALITGLLLACGFSFSSFSPVLPILYFFGLMIMAPKDDYRLRIAVAIASAVVVIGIVVGILVSVLK